MAESPPPQTPDLAVRAFIALFVLGSVLHGFDVMRPDGIKKSVGWWTIATILAVFDWFWARIKTLLGPRFARTANGVATDFRWWAGALMLLFASVVASDIHASPFIEDRLSWLWSSGIVIGVVVFFVVWSMRQGRAVTLPAAILDRIAALEHSKTEATAKIDRIEARAESDRRQILTNYQILSGSLHARDAEAIIKTEDKTVLSLGKRLIDASQNDPDLWASEYVIWEKAMRQIDGLLSRWTENHIPFLRDRLSDIEQSAPSIPQSIKSDNNSARYKILFLAQQSYANRRDGMLQFFSSKAQLP